MYLRSASLYRNAIELLEVELKASSKELHHNEACDTSAPELVKRQEFGVVSDRLCHDKSFIKFHIF